MSLIVTKAVWKHSKATGNARLVLLALAEHVGDERIKRGEAAVAHPSQPTLAEMCGCSRSTVELALNRLRAAGEIKKTGVRHWGKYKGTVEWEVLPGVDFFPEAEDQQTESRSTDSRSANNRQTDSQQPQTDSGSQQTDSQIQQTDLPPLADLWVGHKPVVKPVEVEPGENQELEPGRVSPSAKPDVSNNPNSNNGTEQHPDLPALPAGPLPAQAVQAKQRQVEKEEQKRRDDLAALEAQLERKPNHGPTLRAVEVLRSELGVGPPDDDPVPEEAR